MSTGAGGWIGVDLDGTLALYPYNFPDIGPPIEAMRLRVKAWLAEGKDVRIFTARVGVNPALSSEHGTADAAFAADQLSRILAWCEAHLGRELPVTATKDFQMIELWDDRAIQVVPNQGIPVQELVDWDAIMAQGKA